MKKATLKVNSKTSGKMRKLAKKRGSLPSETKQFLVAFGKRVRELREKEGMSQDQLAFESGMSRTTINRIEQGHYETGVGSLFILAKALSIDERELIDFGER